MLATLIAPARSSGSLSILRIRLMASCSERASSPPSTFQGQTWSRHRHAVSTLRAISSASMCLKTPWGNCTHTDSSQPGTRTKTKTTTSRLTQTELELCPFIRAGDGLRKVSGLVRVVRRLGTARLRSGGILCHAEERCKQRYCDRGVAVPQKQ